MLFTLSSGKRPGAECKAFDFQRSSRFGFAKKKRTFDVRGRIVVSR